MKQLQKKIDKIDGEIQRKSNTIDELGGQRYQEIMKRYNQVQKDIKEKTEQINDMEVKREFFKQQEKHF